MNEIKELKQELIEALNILSSEEFIIKFSSTLEGEAAFLLLLNKLDGSASPTEISNHLGITKARVSALSQALIEKELITEERNKNDRRKINLFLTEKGYQVIETRLLNISKSVDNLISRLGNEKTKQLIEIIDEISNIILEEKKGQTNE